ncbi:MAG: glutathione S-transferase family protein [Ferrovibrio sp.]|nr:glutathione S-transferase family protein [Ferrovibrio sp.]
MQLMSVKGSPYAARVRLQIYRKNLPVEIIFPPQSGLKSAEFLNLNPIGKIPVLLLDDGTPLPESHAILEYLEDKFPEPSLRPEAAEARARMRLLMQVGDLYLFAAIGKLFRQANPAKRDAEAVAKADAEMRRALGLVENWLGPGPFAVGDAYTLADCSLLPVLFFAALMAEHIGLESCFATPRLAAYWAALQADAVSAKVLAELDYGARKMLAK